MSQFSEDLLSALADCPDRDPGSENAFEAREVVLTLLASRPDIEWKEEGVTLPVVRGLTVYALSAAMLFALAVHPIHAASGALTALVAWCLYALWLEGRLALFPGLGSRRFGVNLSIGPAAALADTAVSPDNGLADRPLVLLVANSDSPEARIFARPDIQPHARSLRYLLLAAFFVPPFLMGLLGERLPWPVSVLLLIAALLPVLADRLDAWRRGYTQGGDLNASGLVAAVQAARTLWDGDRVGADVRLLLLSAEYEGGAGARSYVRQRRDSLEGRPVIVIGFYGVGRKPLHVLAESGLLSRRLAGGPLFDLALNAGLKPARLTGAYPTLDAFESVSDATVLLCGADEKGHVGEAGGLDDRVDRLEPVRIDGAARMGEALCRALLPRLSKRSDEISKRDALTNQFESNESTGPKA